MSAVPEIGRHPLHLFQANVFLFPCLLIIVQRPSKGFDCNSHKGGHVLVNCLAFDNGYDYMFESGGSSANTHFVNNVCFGRQEICVGDDDHNAIINLPTKNAWKNNLVRDFSRDDYQSLSEEDAMAPRRGDGSMPARFARLKPESKLIDAGMVPDVQYTQKLADVYAVYPFLQQKIYGAARDLGPYELPVGEEVSTAVQQIISPDSNGGLQVLQGNSADEVIVCYSVPADANVELSVYAVNGQCYGTMPLGAATNGVLYYQPLSTASLPSGMYVALLRADNYTAKVKLIVR